MARGRITAETVNALVPSTKINAKTGKPTDDYLWDDKLAGFGVKVTPAGAKVYLVQYRLNGRRGKCRRYTIGREGSPWRPDSARKRANSLLLRVAEGEDVAAKDKERKRVTVDLAFSAYVREFAKTTLKAAWPKSWQMALAALELHACKHWRDKPLPDITKDDVRRLLKRLDAKPATRRNLYSALSYLFNKSVRDDVLAASPMDGLEAPPTAVERDHTLDEDEIRWMWGASQSIGYPYGPILRLLAILGQRRSEVAALDWRELNRAKGEWDLPAARAKNGSQNLVPLPASAIAEFDAIAGGDKWPRSGLVFASRSGTAPSGFSKAKRAVDAKVAKLAKAEGATVRPWRVHDLRRTVATNLQRLGTPFAVTEHLLNHREKTRTGIGKVYQRHDHKPEKRAALERWEADLERILQGGGGSSVVPFARPAA